MEVAIELKQVWLPGEFKFNSAWLCRLDFNASGVRETSDRCNFAYKLECIHD